MNSLFFFTFYLFIQYARIALLILMKRLEKKDTTMTMKKIFTSYKLTKKKTTWNSTE